MGERTQPFTSLLPVPDRYGLWALSIRNVVSAGAGPRLTGRSLLRTLCLTAVYLVLFESLTIISARSGVGADWNLSLGLGFGVLAAHGWSLVPLLAGGYIAGAVLTSGPLQVAGALSALAPVVALVLGRFVLGRLAPAPWNLTDRRTFFAFLLVVPVVSLAAGLAGSGTAAGAALETASLGARFLGNLAGMMLMAPLSLLVASEIRLLAPNAQRGRLFGRLATWPYFWRGALLSLLLAGTIYPFLTRTLEGEIAAVAALLLPMVGSALLFGLWGVGPVMAVVGLAGIGRMFLGLDLPPAIQLSAVLAAANGAVLGLLVTEQRRFQGTMNHQAALIGAVSFATDQLLGTSEDDRNVREVLSRLAEEARLERVYVLENRHAAEEIPPVLHQVGTELDPAVGEAVAMLRAKYLRRNAESLEEGQALDLRLGDLRPEEQAVLSAAGIGEILLVPVFSDGHWWACLGMDQGTGSRPWSAPEVSTFQATASILGSLLSHTNVEQQFRQFTGSIPVVFWIASPDVLHKTYVSPAYEQIWGRPQEGIRENPKSWMAAIYHEDYARVSELLEGRPQSGFAEEYRIVRPDRSVRWIRDTGFAVVDAFGQVSRIVGIAQDMTAQKEAEERLRASEEQVRTSLHEKEVLLKEIHHRVKNNLQVISSLLNLQGTQIRDSHAAQVFRDSQTRVRAMALVHERLYQSEDLARIDFAGYVRDMTTHLLRSYQSESRGVRLVLDVAGVSLDVDAAIPCALIINETVSNAFKYAFPNEREGEIRISLARDGNVIRMTISDNGVGLPDGMTFGASESLGLQLVHSLTDQLGGTVQLSTENGTRFEIQFPYDR